MDVPRVDRLPGEQMKPEEMARARIVVFLAAFRRLAQLRRGPTAGPLLGELDQRDRITQEYEQAKLAWVTLPTVIRTKAWLLFMEVYNNSGLLLGRRPL